MTNEWLQGYIAALKNIRAFCHTSSNNAGFCSEEQKGYNAVLAFTKQVEDNYRELVEELNGKSES
jgi:hypothetical protein